MNHAGEYSTMWDRIESLAKIKENSAGMQMNASQGLIKWNEMVDPLGEKSELK